MTGPSYHAWTHRPRAQGGTDPLPGGTAIYAIELFEIDEPNAQGDGCMEFEVPEDLDGSELTKVEIYVTTASSSGPVQVQLYNETQAVDMLSTRVQVDQGDLNSKDSATPHVVDADNDEVAWGDHIRIDVDDAGVDSTGLGIVIYFAPAGTSAVVLTGTQGEQGEPGGVTDWTGEWVTATAYTQNQAVSHNGSSYAARVAYTSDATSEPGVGATWETYWMLLASGSSGGASDDPVFDAFGAPSTAFEFNTSSLTGLTAIGSPDAEDADTTVPDHYYIRDDGAGWVGRWIAATPPFTVITHVADANLSYTDGRKIGLFVGDSAPSLSADADILLVGNAANGLWLELASTTNIFSAYSDLQPPYFFGIRVNSSTDIDYLYSPNGRVWKKVVDSRNPSLTIASCGIAMAPLSAIHSAAFNFLRIWNSAKAFPGAVA